MLRSLYVMLDYHLNAADGVQGTAHDFLFDDETWVVHYLVAETASPLGKRKVLILPFALGSPDWERKRLPVTLSSEQVRNSPPLEADMPISLQRETGLKRAGSHLRSLREVLGYAIHGTDGEIGMIEDFIVEDMLWGVHSLVVAPKRAGRSILLPPDSVRSVSWRGKAAWVNLTFEETAKLPDFNPTKPVNHGAGHRLYDYYGRPVSPPAAPAIESLPEASHR